MHLDTLCSNLIDRFYACVVDGEPDDSLLADMAETLGFEAGSVINVRHDGEAAQSLCVMAAGVDIDVCRQAEQDYKVSVSACLRDGSPMPVGRLLERDSLVAIEDLRKQAFFHEFSVPNRLEEGAKMLVYRGDERSIFINFARPTHGADTRRRDRATRILAPHMVRSTLVHVRLEQTESFRRLCWESANLCPYPMVVFDNHKGIFLANSRAESALQADGLMLGRNGLRAAVPKENQKLQELLRNVTGASNEAEAMPHGAELAVSRPSGKRPYQLVVMPLMPGRQSLGLRPAAVVLIFDPDEEQHASISRCRELFGFTRAEAEVAIGVMQGQSPEQIAALQGRSLTTVRNLLKRAFQKADVSRQSELTRLMLRSPMLLPGLSALSEQQWDPFRASWPS